MTEKPLLSVIVPVSNGKEIIGPCLRALRAQEGFNPGEIELIVVDDGSGDGSAEAASGLADRIIRLKQNQGAATARNRGAREARAELLVFVDADVFLEPRALHHLSRLFEARPGLSAAVGRYTEKPAAQGLIAVYHNSFTRFHHDLSEKEIDWFWGALGAVRKRAFWGSGGFNELYRGASAEDMELGRTMAGLGHVIAYCPQAQGAHAHHFTLANMLENDYKKAVLGTKLRLLDLLPRRAPGFAGPANVVSAILAPAFFLVLAASLSNPGALRDAALMAFALLLLNLRFYRYLARGLTRLSLLLAVLLHWLDLSILLLGAAGGALGWLIRRTPYGRPGWI